MIFIQIFMLAMEFILLAIMPVTMLVVGIYMRKSPPQFDNGMYGYHSKRARVSEEAWYYAQRCFSRVSVCLSIIAAVATIVAFIAIDVFILLDTTIRWQFFVLLVSQWVIILAVFPVTEVLLKKRGWQ